MIKRIEFPECETLMNWEEVIIYEDKSTQILECPVCGYTIDEINRTDEERREEL